jgi:hypothetical protein
MIKIMEIVIAKGLPTTGKTEVLIHHLIAGS